MKYIWNFYDAKCIRCDWKQMDTSQGFCDEIDEKSCFCKFRLNADGRFDETSFKISSFPWAINRVKKKR